MNRATKPLAGSGRRRFANASFHALTVHAIADAWPSQNGSGSSAPRLLERRAAPRRRAPSARTCCARPAGCARRCRRARGATARGGRARGAGAGTGRRASASRASAGTTAAAAAAGGTINMRRRVTMAAYRVVTGGASSSTSMVVPPPGLEVNRNWPPRARIRSRMPRTPRCPRAAASSSVAGSKPQPSSWIDSDTRVADRSTWTSIRRAPAWRRTLVIDS